MNDRWLRTRWLRTRWLRTRWLRTRWLRTGVGLWGVALAGVLLWLLSATDSLEPPRALANDAYSCADVTQIPQAECEALVALHTATNGNSWTDDRNWLSDNEPCFWKGVTCATGNVTKIRLDANNLSGALPPALGDLSELTDLDLSSNDIGGSIPSALGSLSRLSGLQLAHNAFTDTIPSDLGSLSALDYLGLNDNRLTGPIPPELGNLASVQNFYLSSNRLTGPIPPELGKLSDVQFVFLSNNLLDGEIPAELGQLAKLLQLNVSRNNLTGSLPASLGDLTMLRRLYVSDNPLIGPLPLTLPKLTALEYFWFQDTFLCDPEDASLTVWLDGVEHLRTSELLCADGPPATLAVTKRVVGPIPATDWQFSGSGSIGEFTLAAAGETVTQLVVAGTYAITETALPGYAAEVACTDGQHVMGGSVYIELAPGAEAGCTFTNTAQPAMLTVVKRITGPAPAQDWAFSGSAGIGPFTLPAGGGSDTFTLTSGSYAVTETTQSGYTATVACTDGSIGGSSVDVDLGPGDETDCTFVNTAPDSALPATLILTKTVVGDSPDSAWMFSGSGGIGPFELPAAGGSTAFVLDAAAYTLTESASGAYTTTVSCTNGAAGERSVSVMLQPGATVGCVFVNTQAATPQGGDVRGVVYEDRNGNDIVDPGEGMADVDVAISDGLAFTRSTTTAVDGIYGFDDVPTGSYTVTVTPPPGYAPPPAETVVVAANVTNEVDPIQLAPEVEYDVTVSLPALHKE